MERQELGQRLHEQQQQDVDTYTAAIDELESTTPFNFDVVKDIHPEIVDNLHQGKNRITKWNEILEPFKDGPKSLITLRWAKGKVPGCYGFGAAPEYETKRAWVRVYENVSMDDFLFVKGETPIDSYVAINKPHDVFTWDATSRRPVQTSDAESAILYQGQLVRDYFVNGASEAAAPMELVIHGDSLREVCLAVDRKIDANLDIGVRIALSDFLYNKFREVR